MSQKLHYFGLLKLRQTTDFDIFGPNRPALNRLQDLGSLQQHEYELEVNKIEEIKQRLAELRKSINHNILVKRCDFRVSVFCRVVQKHYSQVKSVEK